MTDDGPKRRMGAADSATRTALIDAAQQLMAESGYAAVTSRRVAAAAGLKPQLVHYYFATMDDLFLAMIRRAGEADLERQDAVLRSPDPLRALWDINSDPRGTLVATELMALANHRPALREELSRYAEEFRRRQAAAVAPLLASWGIDPERVSAEALLFVVSAVGRVLVLERALGVTTGHGDVLALADEFIRERSGD